MNRKLYFVAALIITLPSVIMAQTATDALRYSETTFGGTARFMSMGGAFGAVGADMSSLTFNPAGIAVFRKSQFLFTPGLTLQTTDATYNGVKLTDNRSMLNVQNIGMIITWKNEGSDSLWKNLNLGVVYNRTNNFNGRINVQGNNSSSSLLDVFAANSNGKSYSFLDPFSTQLAFDVGLIDTSSATSYFSIIPHNNGNVIVQQKSIETSGSMGETDMSFGANYNDKVYLGVTLGMTDIRFKEDDIYSETTQYNDNVYGLKWYTYTTSVNTNGAGLNLKAGIIYKLADWVRLSAAVHTPTYFSLTDDYANTITANYAQSTNYNAGTYSHVSPSGSFDYNLTTPMRLLGGLAFIINHRGIISADYEFVDYSAAQFSSSPDQFATVNREISSNYKATSNVRVGAEMVRYPFSLRLGYAYYGNPYSSVSGNQLIKTSFSGGIGIKVDRLFIDIAYVLTQYNEDYYLYEPSISSPVELKTNLSEVVIGCGVNL